MEYGCHVPFKATNFKQVDTHTSKKMKMSYRKAFYATH